MNESQALKPPILTVTEQPSIGSPRIRVDAPLGSLTENFRMDSSRRFDVYQEFVLLNQKLDLIINRMNSPWYMRLYSWLRRII